MVTRRCKKGRISGMAYELMRILQEKKVTVTEARLVADDLVDMLKENRTRLLETAEHEILFELDEITFLDH